MRRYNMLKEKLKTETRLKPKHDPKFNVGDKVLVEICDLVHPAFDTCFVKGTIEEYVGLMDPYDGRVRQSSVDYPLFQHYYQVKTNNGLVLNNECHITLDPSFNYEKV